MKARLIYREEAYQLLVNNGNIFTFSRDDAQRFLLRYDDEKYYAGPGEWDHEQLTMESYRGETIARIEDDGILSIINASLFRKLMSQDVLNYISVAEYAAKHGKQPVIVRRLCQTGRLQGAVLKGKAWLIPEDSPYPPDARVGKRV